MSDAAHWDSVYERKRATEVSWYRPHLDRSLELLAAADVPPTARVLDVGGGASTLADDLIGRGFTDITVLDLSTTALQYSRERLGALASKVNWLQGDVTKLRLEPASVDVWHDRAVFHFLTDPGDRARYLQQLRSAVRPGGYALIGTFAPDGPERCSGLPVVRYSSDEVVAALGGPFELITDARETHRTPSAATQSFNYVLCRRAQDLR